MCLASFRSHVTIQSWLEFKKHCLPVAVSLSVQSTRYGGLKVESWRGMRGGVGGGLLSQRAASSSIISQSACLLENFVKQPIERRCFVVGEGQALGHLLRNFPGLVSQTLT